MSVRQHQDHALGTRDDLRAEFYALHLQVLDGDKPALDSLAELLLRTLRPRLRRAFPRQDYDVVSDAVEDAILDYAARPGAYDATRGASIDQFVYRASWRNAADRVKSDRRRRIREQSYAVETRSRVIPHRSNDTSSDLKLIDVVADIVRSERERRTYQLLLSGEQKLSLWCDALGCQSSTELEIRAEIRRAKERLIKRLRRRLLKRFVRRPQSDV